MPQIPLRLYTYTKPAVFRYTSELSKGKEWQEAAVFVCIGLELMHLAGALRR